ncbi:hypothetical protein AO269_19295 [Pseudomonas putida]|nr:hypothetical protein AO269_19295 [Pseudomonas putida]
MHIAQPSTFDVAAQLLSMFPRIGAAIDQPDSRVQGRVVPGIGVAHVRVSLLKAPGLTVEYIANLVIREPACHIMLPLYRASDMQAIGQFRHDGKKLLSIRPGYREGDGDDGQDVERRRFELGKDA